MATNILTEQRIETLGDTPPGAGKLVVLRSGRIAGPTASLMLRAFVWQLSKF